MPLKKVDTRIRTLIENGVKTKHRTFFVLIGDHGKDQVVNLHYILSKTQVKARPSALWCYKKDLGFSTHKQKRIRQIKKQISRGLHDPNHDDPFELFISSTDIRWCYYKDTAKILGSTYGMLVLQDFEAMTPNLLARTIETVEGGGIVVMLLRSLASLKQLYTLTMDVHARFRTEAHGDVVPRFNERFILSLGSCANCLVLDDELNILPLSKHSKNLTPLPRHLDEDGGDAFQSPAERELAELKESLKETQPVGALVNLARTRDQAKAILTFVEAISEKSLRSTVALTAARGRGKSAALGFALGAAVAYGYSNIFVTSPSPENLKTVFEFIFKAFDAMHYKEHLDYEAVQSTNPEFNRAIVRVNIFREHRQTIQYIQPHDHEKLAQAELVAIDEAAAIPLPVVRNLLGPYLVFMASTINGYEGTGRSLSLKLMKQLRERETGAGVASTRVAGERGGKKDEVAGAGLGSSGRVLREVTLEEPIRYASGDPIEKWLHELLCLDVTTVSYKLKSGCPHPDQCELYYVNRDSLFSYHKVSEALLQRMMALYVSSHYKNTPNDLQMLSDAPAHHLFVLLGPQSDDGELPDVLCVVQVCLEGQISAESVRAAMGRGVRASGDLVPWTIAQHFQDDEFARLSGARIVRIAVHPDVPRMGYGSRAVQMIKQYYQGDIVGDVLGSDDDEQSETKSADAGGSSSSGKGPGLRSETISPRKDMPPLLQSLEERPAERLHYVAVSYGLTQQLLDFWNKAGFRTLYVRQMQNDLTGEHSCIGLSPLRCTDLAEAPADGWLNSFTGDFARRMTALLAGAFRNMNAGLALTLLSSVQRRRGKSAATKIPALTAAELRMHMQETDVKRLQAYARNLVDYRLVADLIPRVAALFFSQRLGSLSLSPVQRVTLLAMGLQHRPVDDVEGELGVPSHQVLALFNKSMRKLANYFRARLEAEAEEELRSTFDEATEMRGKVESSMAPVAVSLDQDLTEGGIVVDAELKKKQADLLSKLNLMEYAVDVDDADLAAAMKGKTGDAPTSVSVKKSAKKRKAGKDGAEEGGDTATPRSKKQSNDDGKKTKSKKKKKKKAQGSD